MTMRSGRQVATMRAIVEEAPEEPDSIRPRIAKNFGSQIEKTKVYKELIKKSQLGKNPESLAKAEFALYNTRYGFEEDGGGVEHAFTNSTSRLMKILGEKARPDSVQNMGGVGDGKLVRIFCLL